MTNLRVETREKLIRPRFPASLQHLHPAVLSAGETVVVWLSFYHHIQPLLRDTLQPDCTRPILCNTREGQKQDPARLLDCVLWRNLQPEFRGCDTEKKLPGGRKNRPSLTRRLSIVSSILFRPFWPNSTCFFWIQYSPDIFDGEPAI